MNYRDKLDRSFIFIALSLIVFGFAAGFGARGYFTDVPALVRTSTTCNQIGADLLSADHSKRMHELRGLLAAQEADASNIGNIESVSQRYLENANRIREDIAQEAQVFRVSVMALRSNCAND